MNQEEVFKDIKDKGIEFIRLQFIDVFGIMKSTSIMASELDRAFGGELMFDGSSIDGFASIHESDQCIVPDPDTYAVMPWRPQEEGVARMICDVYSTDGAPFHGCPRHILKKALREVEQMGFEYNIGPEGEFFLFHADDQGYPLFDIHDHAGYFDLAPFDLGEDARRSIILTLKKMGFQIESSHHEVAPGQHEIDFKYGEALRTADNWVTFRDVVKNIARQSELYATFMPKPLSGENGSAMHCNQSLFKDGQNVFFAPQAPDGLSDLARFFIGGLLKHARGLAAIANPIVNSYKRLKPGYEAPTNVAWSTNNRSTLIRVPAARGNSTRIEYRSPDPTANPYLLFALMLRAGLDGVKNQIIPPPPLHGNGYAADIIGSSGVGPERYPRHLAEALEEMVRDPLIIETIGEHVFNNYLLYKQKEWAQYAECVHEWEIRRYLNRF